MPASAGRGARRLCDGRQRAKRFEDDDGRGNADEVLVAVTVICMPIENESAGAVATVPFSA